MKKKKIIIKEKTILKMLKPITILSSPCEICKKKEYDHEHHIEFDKKTGKSNKDSKIQKLCTLCHAKIHGIEPKRSELKDKCVLLNRNQKTRIVIANQIRGFGRIEMKVPDYYLKIKDELIVEEKKLVKEISSLLERDQRSCAKTQGSPVSFPIYSWLKNIRGMGPLNIAYLLGYINFKNTPSVSALWCYCGQTPDSKFKKGVKANWNPILKQRCFMISESFIKLKSSYKEIYDVEKERQLELMEKDPTSVTKTQEGYVTPSIPKSRMHCHRRAMRKMVKQFLKEMWIEQHNIQEKKTIPSILKSQNIMSSSLEKNKK